MTDNGPSTEYLFIYPWTVTAAVPADTHLCTLRWLVLSSPAKDLTAFVYMIFSPAVIEDGSRLAVREGRRAGELR